MRFRKAQLVLARVVLMGVMVDELQVAVEALNRGDPEPLVALMADELEWRGVSRGMLWWKRTPE